MTDMENAKATASYLEQYDRIPADRPQEKVGLVSRWIRTDWRPFFQELREARPIFRTPAFTLVTRFPDVREVLERNEVFTVRLYAPKMDPVVDGPFMLARDNTPVNWREKSIMKAMLLPEDLPAVRAMAGKLADAALDRAAREGRIEVVNGLGRLVPIRICGDYFGFPGPDTATMFRWSRATQSDMFKNLGNDPAVHAVSVEAGREMRAYLAELLPRKRKVAGRKPKAGRPADVFGRLIRTHFPQEIAFDDARILANMAGLLIGTGETTSQAIVQSLEQILLRPEVLRQAVEAAQAGDDPAFDAIVWEALRFNPINPLLFRLCEADYRLAAGTDRQAVIPARTIVFACTASAVFDPAELPDPEAFHPARPAYHSFHFGYGDHTCLGKYVGMMIIPEVIKRVVLRPGLRLLPGDEGKIDFQGGPFPERFLVAYGP